jgi:hypothetical protein
VPLVAAVVLGGRGSAVTPAISPQPIGAIRDLGQHIIDELSGLLTLSVLHLAPHLDLVSLDVVSSAISARGFGGDALNANEAPTLIEGHRIGCSVACSGGGTMSRRPTNQCLHSMRDQFPPAMIANPSRKSFRQADRPIGRAGQQRPPSDVTGPPSNPASTRRRSTIQKIKPFGATLWLHRGSRELR